MTDETKIILAAKLRKRADQIGKLMVDPPRWHPDAELMRQAASALAAPVDHPEVVGVKSAAEALDNVQSWVMQQRIELRPLDPDFHAKHDTLKAVGAKIRSEKAAPSDSPALEAGVVVTDAKVERACDAAYKILSRREGIVFTGLERRPVPDAIKEWMGAALTAALATPAKEQGKRMPLESVVFDSAGRVIAVGAEADDLMLRATRESQGQPVDAEPRRRDASCDPIPWEKQHDHFMGFDPENPDIPTD